MKLPEMKTGFTVSAAAHAGLLAWGLMAFAIRPLDSEPKDALPVDIISSTQFSELSKGVKNAPKAETPKPLVDKVGETKLAPEATPKVAEKPEIKTASAEPPPAPAAEAKPDKKPPPKVDPIAEALKKEEAKKKAEARAEAKAKAEQQKQQPPQPKFDANQIAALLDKRNPQRVASTGSEVNTTPSLGVPNAMALRLSQSELDAMRARLMQLWSPPAGVQNPEEVVVVIRIRLGRDRMLAGQPQVMRGGRGPLYEIARENAIRALYRGQPYDMLTERNYEIWKDVEIVFDPREMIRG